MAKITVEIESRVLPVSQDERDVAELFELTGLCEFNDDVETDNGFDVYVRSDYDRFATSVSHNTAGQVQSDQRSTAIIVTRTSDTELTRTTGTWTIDELKGYRAWCYDSSLPDGGTWFAVLSNTATIITIQSGTLPAIVNRVQVQAQSKIRHFVQLTPQCDFYGGFFQYRVVKKISSVDGKFNWFGVKGSAIPRNVDPEFFSGMGAISNGW